MTAIQGYQVYKKFWQAELNETLVYDHERGNEFDFFSVKAVCVADHTTVGHLPKEISPPDTNICVFLFFNLVSVIFSCSSNL